MKKDSPWAVTIVGGSIAAVLGTMVGVYALGHSSRSPSKDPESTNPSSLRPTVSRSESPTATPTSSSSVPSQPNLSWRSFEPVPQTSTIYLTDFDGFDVKDQSTGPATVNAKTYAHSIIECECGGRTVQADLGRRYARFEATIGLSDKAPSDAKFEFDAYTERGLIFSKTMGFGSSAPVSLNIADALRLQLRVVQIAPDYNDYWAVWGDARLIS